MKSSLRPTTAEDYGALRDFLRQAFEAPESAPFLGRRLMEWKYWAPRGDWEGPRSYILERDGAIVAHAAIYPLVLDAGRARGAQMLDWASAAGSPGAGLALVQKLTRMFDFLYSIGGSEMTRKVLPGFGFVEHARQWKAAVPLRPLRQMRDHQHRNWKLAPRLARNFLWSRSRRLLPQGWELKEVQPREIGPDLTADARFSPRPVEFFEYLARNPACEVRLYRISNPAGSQGHFVLALLRGQARLAGLWLRRPDPDAWRAAFSLARRAALELPQICEIAAAGTQGASEQAAIEAGFHLREHVPVYLLNRKEDLRFPHEFQFQLCDDDQFLFDAGVADYWT